MSHIKHFRLSGMINFFHEKSPNSARRDLRSFRRESSVSTRAALKKHQRCKNNDSIFIYSSAKAKKKEERERRKVERSLYNYILLRCNDLQLSSRVAYFALSITTVACHSS